LLISEIGSFLISDYIFHGPLVVVARKGTLDKPLFINGDCWVIDTAYAVLPNANIDAKWLYYNLLKYDLKKLNESTGVPSISRDYLYRVTFETFPLPEQRKIARILSTVDAVIEKSEAAIAKYKAIKSGMMRDLFTRGIDLTTGKLRPRYEDAPELYKQSELGWVPKEWEVVRIGECSDTGFKYGINAAATEFTPLLPVYLRITDIDDDGHFIAKNKTSVNSIESKNYVLVDGDIVFARTGATVGKTYLYDKNDGELVFAGFLIKFNPNSNKLHPYYLKTYTESGFYKNWVIIYSSRSGQPGINGKEYADLLISLPKIEEQRQIVKSFLATNKTIINEQTFLGKYQQLKAALMSDLLTGKVRVKYNEEIAEAQ